MEKFPMCEETKSLTIINGIFVGSIPLFEGGAMLADAKSFIIEEAQVRCNRCSHIFYI